MNLMEFLSFFIGFLGFDFIKHTMKFELHELIFILCFQCQENFVQKAQEKLSYLIKSEGPSSISSPALQTGTPASKRDRRTDTKASVTSCTLASGTVKNLLIFDL